MRTLIDSIKHHEGYVGTVYKDTLGFDTIGFGTKIPLSKSESEMILEHRLSNMIEELKLKEPFFKELPDEAKDVISEMAYQMGVNGVLNFKKMWSALKDGNYEEAGAQMLNSVWRTQTKTRAENLAQRMETLAWQ
jgi:lysozyme